MKKFPSINRIVSTKNRRIIARNIDASNDKKGEKPQGNDWCKYKRNLLCPISLDRKLLLLSFRQRDTKRTMITMEVGIIIGDRIGSRTARPQVSMVRIGKLPVTALIMLTAGVSRPSAITQLAPNSDQINKAPLKIMDPPIDKCCIRGNLGSISGSVEGVL